MSGLRIAAWVAFSCAAAFAAHADGVDWSKAKPITDEGVGWGIIPPEGGKVEAFYGRPESDYVVVRLSCPATRTIAFSYIDSTMKPHANYRVHLRTAGHVFEIPGTTAERWEMDDLVELRFGPVSTRQLYDDLRGGAELRLVIDEAAGGWTTALALAGDAKALAPFFAACGK